MWKCRLKVNPHLLIFVEGVEIYPDNSQPNGILQYWWGAILIPVARYPVALDVPHQLVYSPHEYGPAKFPYTWFNNMTYRSIVRVWNHAWGFILQHPASRIAAPIFIGEFGTCTDSPECINARAPGNQATWFHYFIRFLCNHPSVGWSIWALNGTNGRDAPATNGVLNAKWDGIANQSLQRLLNTIESSP